uniref:Growth factor receptor domain-containing protein n=1 Tax=Apteryx owenii TaxID=8824 RepID=A0A8B9S5G3_APTOW
CDGPGPDHCTDCLHYYYKSKNNTRICVLNCPPGHYNADKKRCKKCSPNCETCVGGHSDQCMTCKSGYYLNEVTNSCVTSCPDGFYLDKKCEACHRSCATCVGYSYENCTACKNNFQLSHGQCVEDCPSHFYAEDKQCFPCHRDCKDCDGPDSDDCNECATSSFVLYYGEYFTQNSTGSCERCHKSCKECMGPQPTDCLFCDTYFYLLRSKNECVSSCPEYYYENKDNNMCERCHPSCRTCKGKSIHSALTEKEYQNTSHVFFLFYLCSSIWKHFTRKCSSSIYGPTKLLLI